MSPTLAPVHHLAQQVRAYGPTLLATTSDPHAELMAMVWGPRFDREHAMGLWAGLPQHQSGTALPALRALLSAADRFDTLAAPAQHRLRLLILRHRAAGQFAKRALLLAISHELRSPLTRARLNTEMLPDTAEVQPSREALLRDLALMRDLVTDLLESERLASPHVALQREPTQLAELVPEIVAEVVAEVLHNTKASHPAQASVVQTIAANLPVLALDRTRMRLLLRNLLDNALQHNTAVDGSPLQAVVVSVQRTLEGGVRITVRDFGPGVSDAALPHLAEPFYRPDAARERATGGVGLGLYLCKLVAQAHGGSLAMRNALPGLEVGVVLPGPANATPPAPATPA